MSDHVAPLRVTPRRQLTLLAGTAALLASVLLSTGCGGPAEPEAAPQMPPPPVATATALRQTYAPTLELTGRFVASQQVEVRPQITGRITKIMIADGAHVEAGDELIQIEEAPLKAALARSQALLQRAQARLMIAQQRERRNRQLADTDIVAAELLDEIDAEIATATADIAAAQAAIDANTIELDYATITAPISGRVGRVLVNTGDMVQGGGGGGDGSQLLTIVADDTIDVVTGIPEDDYLLHAARLHAALNDMGEIGIMVDAGADSGLEPLPARLHMIDNRTTAGSGVVRVYLRLPNPNGYLLPGVFARVLVQLAAPHEVLVIHEHAVQAHMSGRFVYTVDGEGVTAMAPVELGDRIGTMRVVESGLTGDESIALTNLKMIFFPGMPVMPVPGDMTTATALPMPMPMPEGTTAPGSEQAHNHTGDQP